MITILGASLLQFSLAILNTFRKSHSCPRRHLWTPKEWVPLLGMHRVERMLTAVAAFFPAVWLVLPKSEVIALNSLKQNREINNRKGLAEIPLGR